MIVFNLHPFTGRDPGGVNIQGAIERTPQALVLSIVLHGNLGDLVLPDGTERTRCDNLWKSTCFEMFWAEEGRKNYWELNLAPNGAWNVYAFPDYRTGMNRENRVGEPPTNTEHTTDTFSLTAELGIGKLHIHNTPLRVGVSAVLKHQNSRLSYWALAHPKERPDFHAPQSFLLQI
ncbi:MAG: DOMON-like domain-containing protein [Proteobacteria bacterium]|nr:DOMON-like domain-containing protein [Pseudomonadota bacterium]MBU1546733.1 DOMON-like domain-containing protein [Pseudomonadota bacterium]MBU2618538.1 DOMON-like domain-containing protein [Pseudomonadota bacterium]